MVIIKQIVVFLQLLLYVTLFRKPPTRASIKLLLYVTHIPAHRVQTIRQAADLAAIHGAERPSRDGVSPRLELRRA